MMKIFRKLEGWLNNKWDKFAGKAALKDTDFLPAALEVTETPPSPGGRLILWTIIVFIAIVLLWSVFGTVEEVAVATGKIIPNGAVKTIQAEDKGVVKAIAVREGQTVKKGDLLVELDATISGADLAKIKKEAAYFNLEIERLMAEQGGAPFIPTPSSDLDPKDIAFQMGLYQSRQTEYNARVATANANIRQNEASIRIAQTTMERYSSQLEIASEKERRIRSLVEQQAVSLFVLLDYQSKRMELENSLIAQEQEIGRLEAALLQSRENLASITAERNRDIAKSLVEDRRQLTGYQEELKKAAEKERLARIVSPIDGRVAQLSIYTVGGVVTAAQPLMVIVPEDATLEVEAWAANKDIGFLSGGQRAEVKVETFNFQKYGTIGAEVTAISPDAVDDKEKGRVFRVALKLDNTEVKVNGRPVLLSPGMSATAEIKIREKRIIDFFLEPFRQMQDEAFRER